MRILVVLILSCFVQDDAKPNKDDIRLKLDKDGTCTLLREGYNPKTLVKSEQPEEMGYLRQFVEERRKLKPGAGRRPASTGQY